MAYDVLTGEMVFFGGHRPSDLDNDQTWTWKDTKWTLRDPAHHPEARSAHAMTSAFNLVYLVGGSQENPGGGFGRTFDDTWVWNGTDWTKLNFLTPAGFAGHGLVFAAGQRLILFGGIEIGELVDSGVSNKTLILPFPFTAWTDFSTPAPPARERHAMAWDAAQGLAVLFGGKNGETIYGDTWTFGGRAPDILTESTPLRTPPCAQDTFFVTPGGPGPYTYQWQRVVNGGGINLGDNAHFSGTRAQSFTISPFRPADTGLYRVLLSNECGTTPSRDFSVAIEPGGWGGGGQGPPRFGAALAYDSARARMVVFGGTEQINGPPLEFITYGDTWERVNNGWALVSIGGPSPRFGAAMAYDAARGVTVLFGGVSDTATYNDTWEWDGTTWTQRADGPVARSLHAMVYDTERQRVQLYGGSNLANGFQLGDLSEWDGTEWVARGVVGDPSYNAGSGGWPAGREHPALAYDTARHALVLHGGFLFSGPDRQFGETWELIDNHWHFKGVSGGALARGVEVAGYHEAHGKTILFTPPETAFDIGVTWEWDGALPWKQVPVASTEPPREIAANMVYDAARKELVLYGGRGPFGAYSERNLVFFDDIDPTCGVPSVCGDGIVDADEVCDDLGVGPCCTASCQFESPGTGCGTGGRCTAIGTCVSPCGDGVLEAGEECDDSATPGRGCCSPTCGGLQVGPCGDVCRGDRCASLLGPPICRAGNADSGGCSVATSALGYLGSAGGSLATPDGSVTLVVPPGVGPTGTYSIATGLAASGFSVGTSGTRVLVARLGPAGTVFAPPGALLTFRWPDADNDGRVDGVGLDEQSLRIVHDGVAIGALCATAPGCNTAANTWTIFVTSFSEFVLVSEPCSTDVPIATLKLAKLLAPGGDDTLAFKATFPLTAGAPVDPSATGLRLVVQDDVGTTIADIQIPPGSYDKGTKTGWKANKKLTIWSYAKQRGSKAILKRGKGDAVTVTVTGVGGTFSAPLLPHVTVFLSDRCATLAFDGAGKSCAVKSKGKTLACKAAPPR